jgi:hypothetical protein
MTATLARAGAGEYAKLRISRRSAVCTSDELSMRQYLASDLLDDRYLGADTA